MGEAGVREVSWQWGKCSKDHAGVPSGARIPEAAIESLSDMKADSMSWENGREIWGFRLDSGGHSQQPEIRKVDMLPLSSERSKPGGQAGEGWAT